MADIKMANDTNFERYNQKNLMSNSFRSYLKTISILAVKQPEITLEKPHQKTDSVKKAKKKVEKSTESIKQTKLEDLRQEAQFAQRSREEREDGCRKRTDELRSRNNDRRNRVEERKRLIFEAEKEKRAAILRKNQEIEARIEAKKNKDKEEKKKKKIEKLNKPVAFGSSTPRMLCPNDTNGSFCSSCWHIAKECDSTKKRAIIFTDGHGKKHNEDCNGDARRRKTSSANFQTNWRRTEQPRRMQHPRDESPTSESICIPTVKVFARLPRTSSGETSLIGRSRSNSSMSQQSSSTNSLDSCNLDLRPRRTIRRLQKSAAVVDNSILVTIQPVEVKRDSSDAPLIPVKSLIPKLQNTQIKLSTPTPNKVKKRLIFENLSVKEKEDQLLMEKTMHLANEMMEIERQRLKMAIEETKRWEEEERRKEEEKARKKLEKEKAERKAREEAERQRIELIARLRRDEEERLARRKRVQTIMSRTRGENRFHNTNESQGRSR